MFLSWGAWGVFVACSVLTLMAAASPVLALLPRRVMPRELVFRLAAATTLGLLLVGWGLVALLNPEYAVGWRIPGKGPNGGIDVFDGSEARFAGWTLFGLGAFCIVLAVLAGAFPSLGEWPADRKTPRRVDVRSGNPAVKNGGRKMRVRDHLR